MTDTRYVDCLFFVLRICGHCGCVLHRHVIVRVDLDDEERHDVFELLKRLLVALVDSRDSVVVGSAVCRAICELLCQPEKEVFGIRPSHLGVVVQWHNVAKLCMFFCMLCVSAKVCGSTTVDTE